MFFEEHERKIYSPATKPDLKFDPLAVDRAITKAMNGFTDSLELLLRSVQPVTRDSGDVSMEGQAAARVTRADAEEQLAAIARKAFGFSAFPDCTDAEALEVLYDYLEWMEKKGERGDTPPTSLPFTDSGSTTVPAPV